MMRRGRELEVEGQRLRGQGPKKRQYEAGFVPGMVMNYALSFGKIKYNWNIIKYLGIF